MIERCTSLGTAVDRRLAPVEVRRHRVDRALRQGGEAVGDLGRLAVGRARPGRARPPAARTPPAAAPSRAASAPTTPGRACPGAWPRWPAPAAPTWSSAVVSTSSRVSRARNSGSSSSGLPCDVVSAASLLQPRDPRLDDAGAGDAGPLVAEQELRVVPARVLLADELVGRDPDVVEEDLVDLVAAVDEADRPDRDARASSCRSAGTRCRAASWPRGRCGPGRRSSRPTGRAWSTSSGR